MPTTDEQQGPRLTAEREAEIAERAQRYRFHSSTAARDYADDVPVLRAELDALRALLAPFAAYADLIASDPAAAPYPDTCPLGVCPTSREERPTLGDCRRAREALGR
jgi:hypothetical protein